MSQSDPPVETPDDNQARPFRGRTTVVGIGASAGGLAALKAFFAYVPRNSSLAFVIVVHLSPEHESHLADLLQPHVNMPVEQVTETTPLEPDHVYVIPPGRNLGTIDTHLRLTDLEEQRRKRAPIDHFFQTLAKTHEDRAVGVILTGSGSDGTLGIKEIKEKGGLTIVQDPEEAAYDGMPRSAIATSLIDLVLPVAEIPGQILGFARTVPRITLPEEGQDLEEGARRLLGRILAHVRTRTGRDFSRYKVSTIMRRLRRRMQITNVEDLEQYLELLRVRTSEIQALADEFLITVTRFFRDREVFEVLEKEVIPQLFEGKQRDDQVRLWSVGCATGEEAYSLAMLLLETAARHESPVQLQIFASDLHEPSLRKAREGLYPGDIEADVSTERLHRFFTKEAGGYRIRREVRELVVFAAHNFLSDPPFSKIDLISFRNVMIYLQRSVQREIVSLFHYSLTRGGFLALGSSEAIDNVELFHTSHKQQRIYEKRNVPAPNLNLPVFPLARPSRLAASYSNVQAPASYTRLHQRMIGRYAPPSLLVSPDNRIVYVSKGAGRYLAHPVGEITSNVVRLVLEELRIELRTTLHRAEKDTSPQRSRPIPTSILGMRRSVILEVWPVEEQEYGGFKLVIFDDREVPAESAAWVETSLHATAHELENELELTKQRLQSIIEEYETSKEEMRASNEELQSMNEEFRSTMEELEMSKEELQSMNEELTTLNQENRHKVEELSQLSGDLQNLLQSTDIATLFLSRDLRILRFTPRVSELFNVRITDQGRPLSDLRHRLGYEELSADATQVVERLIPIEREVQDETGRWYLTRLLPYRSLEDRIEGVVITLVEITGRKRAELALQHMNETLETNVEDRTKQVRQLSLRLTMAEQEERHRISLMLHDDLQQLLFGVETKLDMISKDMSQIGSEHLMNDIEETRGWVTKAVETTRKLAVDLSPPVLKGEELSAMLAWLKRQMSELHGLEVTLGTEHAIAVPDDHVRMLLFQIVRELLLNVKKHAGVDQAAVTLAADEAHLVIHVIDQGRGFDVKHVLGQKDSATGFGLFSVRERLNLLGGRLEIVSEPGRGTHIEVHAPVLPDQPA